MKDGDFGKPIIAVVNSFTQFVPGHVHLKDLGQLVAREIEAAGGVAKEFNTIAVDDGIAMGHSGMLYSLPSRELIADSVEYMANAHCADALVCISNCDKITPGMLMAALRLNIPAIFVSGGPMEAGKVELGGKTRAVDLIDAMIVAADPQDQRRGRDGDGAVRLPDLRLLLRHVYGQQHELPHRGARVCPCPATAPCWPRTPTARSCFSKAGRKIVELCKRYYEQDDESVLPRSIATFKAFENAMTLDIAMGGSTNTVLHLLAAAHEAGVDFTMADIDRLSRRVPVSARSRPPSDVHVEDVHRAGGIHGILGELDRAGLLNRDVHSVHADNLAVGLAKWDIKRTDCPGADMFYRAAPGGVPTQQAFSQKARYEAVDSDRAEGCDPQRRTRFFQGRRPRRSLRQPRRGRRHREDGGRGRQRLEIHGTGRGLREPGRCRKRAFWPAR